MSCASLPDTNLCLAATFHVWPAMLGEWAGIVKEIAPLWSCAREALRQPQIHVAYRGRDSTEVFLRSVAHGGRNEQALILAAHVRMYREIESHVRRLTSIGLRTPISRGPLDIQKMIVKMLPKIGRCCWGFVFGDTKPARAGEFTCLQ